VEVTRYVPPATVAEKLAELEAENKNLRGWLDEATRRGKQLMDDRDKAEAENRELQLDLADVLRKRELCETRRSQVEADALYGHRKLIEAEAALASERDVLAWLWGHSPKAVAEARAAVKARAEEGSE
jgi:chromosome segregation ATPase